VKARLILILSVAMLPPLAAAAFGQPQPPGVQVVPMFPGTPPAAVPLSPGQILLSQMHKRRPGIRGFYDPATGKFTPSGGIVPKRPGGGGVPNAPADADVTVHIETESQFDSALKPYNTLNCTAQIEVVFETVFTYEIYEDDRSYQAAVGYPPKATTFGLPITLNSSLSEMQGSMSCTATDDNGVLHQSSYNVLSVTSGKTYIEMFFGIWM
jgi:hypothetical protein